MAEAVAIVALFVVSPMILEAFLARVIPVAPVVVAEPVSLAASIGAGIIKGLSAAGAVGVVGAVVAVGAVGVMTLRGFAYTSITKKTEKAASQQVKGSLEEQLDGDTRLQGSTGPSALPESPHMPDRKDSQVPAPQTSNGPPEQGQTTEGELTPGPQASQEKDEAPKAGSTRVLVHSKIVENDASGPVFPSPVAMYLNRPGRGSTASLGIIMETIGTTPPMNPLSPKSPGSRVHSPNRPTEQFASLRI